jgi:tetratricopeptide (TPR) repeat protein
MVVWRLAVLEQARRLVNTVAVLVLPLTLLCQTSPYEQAVAYLQKGELGPAMQLLDSFLKQAPRDLKARTLMGLALSAAGKQEEAHRQFKQALEIDPRFAPALKNLAVTEMALGRADEAKTHFEQLLAITPGDRIAHLGLGEIYFSRKEFQQSLAHYGQTGGLYLKDPRNLLNFAGACVEVGRAKDATDTLAHLPEGAEPAVQFEAGVLLARAGSFDAAASRFQLARRGYRDPYEVSFNLSLAYFRGEEYPAAMKTAEELVAGGHQKAELYNLLARIYEKSSRIKDAYDSYRKATEIEPADETNYVDLIALCLTHKNFELALEIADIGIRRLPQSSRLHLQRGIVFAVKGQFPEARKAFESTLALAPETSLPYVALGLVMLQMDQVSEAIEVLRRRTLSGRDDYLAEWFLGEALNRSGARPGTQEEQEAIQALEKSVRLKPDLVHSRTLFGKMLLRRGDLKLAAEQLEKALELEPENIPATYQLAHVYSKQGDSERAKELFAKVSKVKADEREQFTTGGLERIVREGTR